MLELVDSVDSLAIKQEEPSLTVQNPCKSKKGYVCSASVMLKREAGGNRQIYEVH